MNNQMDDLSAQPGMPNFFGLVGAEANAVAPGKRPRPDGLFFWKLRDLEAKTWTFAGPLGRIARFARFP